MNFIKIIGVFILAGILFLSCKKEEEPNNNPTDPYSAWIKVGEGYALGAGLKLELFAKESLFVGYNKIVVRVADSITNQPIKHAAVAFLPRMNMGSMSHSSPYENPSAFTSEFGKYEGAVVFSMPSGEMDSWEVSVQAQNLDNSKIGAALIAITVINPSTAKLLSIMPDSVTKLILSYVEPSAPKVGINDFEVTLHKKMSMDSFPADSVYTLEIEPEMPSMGHGSPNNVNPSHNTKGHYKGKVNFTMSGAWRIHLVLKQDGITRDSLAYFDVTIP